MNSFEPTFRFKEFGITDRRCGLKIGTDGVLLGAWARCPRSDGSILDVGAGCGLIGMMLSSRYPHAKVKGVEIDDNSMMDFKENLANFPWADRIEPIYDDFRAITESFDLIVSNPPFFTNGASAPDMSRARARHAGALSPESLPSFASRHLNPGGRLAMISPVEPDSDVELACALAHMSIVRKVEVATSKRRGITRILWEMAVADEQAKREFSEPITVGDSTYIELTRRFYLHY